MNDIFTTRQPWIAEGYLKRRLELHFHITRGAELLCATVYRGNRKPVKGCPVLVYVAKSAERQKRRIASVARLQSVNDCFRNLRNPLELSLLADIKFVSDDENVARTVPDGGGRIGFPVLRVDIVGNTIEIGVSNDIGHLPQRIEMFERTCFLGVTSCGT